MRTLFNIGILTVILATFWLGGQTIARQQHVGVSVDPFSLTATMTNLPTAPKWDLY